MSNNISQIQQMPYSQYLQMQQNNPNFAAGSKGIAENQVVQNNPLLNAASTTPDNPLTFLASIGLSTAALMKINNYINKPLQTKDYNDTFFKKLETSIDNFATKHNFNKVTQPLNNFADWVKKQANKSEILRTLFTKPSIGGPMVQSQAVGAKNHIATRAIEIMKTYKEKHPNFNEFDAILKKAEKDSYKYADEIIQTIKNSSANLKEVMSNRPWWGMGIVKNKSSLQEILNKDILINNYKAAGKTLGQKVSGYLMRGAECLTNGLFSGKGAVLLQGLMIAQSISEANKAEKGEKFSTFMASLVELMAFMATMSIQQRVVNHLAGLKNIGLLKPEVKAYQKFVQIANNAAKAGDKALYDRAIAKIKCLELTAKANTKWYQKPIKALGKLVSLGRIRETVKPLKNSKIATAFAKIPYGLKVGAGYAGRVALIMAAIIPIFSGVAKKVSYAIFGKPVKTLEREKLKEELENNPQEQVQPAQQQTPQQTVVQPAKGKSLVEQLNDKYKQQPNNIATPVASQPITQSVTQPQATSPETAAGIKRSYIPNAILGTENTINLAATRNAQIDAILRQADIAEANAQRFL